MSSPDPGALLAAAVEAARAAGARQREAVGGRLAVTEFHDHDVKLELDSECQRLITGMLGERFPEMSVLGEEEGGAPHGATEWQWIVDPVDGTVNLYYGIPHFCVAIALQHRLRTVLAVTYDPIRDELFTAQEGSVTRLNGREVAVSRRTQLKDALVATGFAKAKEMVEAGVERVRYFGLNARKVRMNGCAALDLAYVACGRLDAYLEEGTRLWDLAGGVLLVQCAGGRVKLVERVSPPLSYKIVASSGRFEVPEIFGSA
ncbi:MAG TPA: inositol monophosphatase family protein [Verrucomicrobiae bacterium]|nr:inositol monophosphatase family protein [Verrucomicrobiae bacterium]